LDALPFIDKLPTLQILQAAAAETNSGIREMNLTTGRTNLGSAQQILENSDGQITTIFRQRFGTGKTNQTSGEKPARY
jgi:hypothetical protein